MAAYQRVADLYANKRYSQAYELFRSTLDQGVELVSQSEEHNQPNDVPTMVIRAGGVLRSISESNIRYAKELANQNRYDAAMGVIRQNELMAKKIAFARPRDFSGPFLISVAIWNSSEDALISTVKAAGDQHLAEQINNDHKTKLQYFQDKIYPVMETGIKAGGAKETAALHRAKTLWFRCLGWTQSSN